MAPALLAFPPLTNFDFDFFPSPLLQSCSRDSPFLFGLKKSSEKVPSPVTLLDIMVNITGSFISPSADATVSPQFIASAGVLASVLDGFTIWKLLGTLFIAAVIYDQCKCAYCPRFSKSSQWTFFWVHTTNNPFYSQIPLLQGFNYRSCIQDSLHGSILGVCQPQVHRVQGQMGQRRSELCLCLPQVSSPGQDI